MDRRAGRAYAVKLLLDEMLSPDIAELLDGRGHGMVALGERGASDPVKPRLARDHLDDHQPDAIRRGEDCLDIGDLQRWQTARGGRR